MYMYIYIYIQTCIYKMIFICIYLYLYVYICIHIFMCTYINRLADPTPPLIKQQIESHKMSRRDGQAGEGDSTVE